MPVIAGSKPKLTKADIKADKGILQRGRECGRGISKEPEEILQKPSIMVIKDNRKEHSDVQSRDD